MSTAMAVQGNKPIRWELGRTYVTRDGGTATLVRIDEGDPVHPYHLQYKSGGKRWHREDGRSTLADILPENDIVGEWTGPMESSTGVDSGVKFDSGKPDLSLLPGIFKADVALAMMDGAEKYGRWNYAKGMEASRLLAAAERHLDALKRGEWIVPDSKRGTSHAGAVAANMLMLIHILSLGRLKDDRLIETQGKSTEER